MSDEDSGLALARRSGKSEAAFRTISEVADDLEVPQHVLRFWEGRFPQVRPLKRGGGRRYYRPEDVVLLRRIRDLLYREGYTIKGVQKLLKDGPVPHAEDGPAALDDEAGAAIAPIDDGADGPRFGPTADAADPDPEGAGRQFDPDLRVALHGVLSDLEALRAMLHRR